MCNFYYHKLTGLDMFLPKSRFGLEPDNSSEDAGRSREAEGGLESPALSAYCIRFKLFTSLRKKVLPNCSRHEKLLGCLIFPHNRMGIVVTFLFQFGFKYFQLL